MKLTETRIRRQPIVSLVFSHHDRIRLTDSAWFGRRSPGDHRASTDGSTCRTRWCPLALVCGTPYRLGDRPNVSDPSSCHELCHKNSRSATSATLASSFFVRCPFWDLCFERSPLSYLRIDCSRRSLLSLPVSNLPRHDHLHDRVARTMSTPIRLRAYATVLTKTLFYPSHYV